MNSVGIGFDIQNIEAIIIKNVDIYKEKLKEIKNLPKKAQVTKKEIEDIELKIKEWEQLRYILSDSYDCSLIGLPVYKGSLCDSKQTVDHLYDEEIEGWYESLRIS